MKKAFFLLAMAAGLLASSCKSDGAAANNNGTDTTATASPASKAVKQGELKKVLGKDLKAKFGIDILVEREFYDAKYEYYLDASGQEVLHGKFNVKSGEALGDFVERLKPAGKEEGEPEVFELYFEYSDEEFDGQFVDGVKDGKMTFKMASHESGGSGYILYDAKTKGATYAKYDGGAEAYEISYDGPVKKGTFEELFGLTVTKEME